MKHPSHPHPHLPCGPTLLLAAGLAACGGADGTRAQPQNVLLITLDTTRPDHMGCYGAARDTTPRIDQLAADGVLFQRAVSTAGITPMSHASILTGLNNYRHGMRVFHSEECSHRLKDEVDTLAEILGRAGYRTAAAISAYPVSRIYNLDQGFDAFRTGLDYDQLDLTAQQKHATEWDSSGVTNTQRRGDLTVADAIAWLDERGTGGDPWCMWVHLFDVHDYSLVPPQDYVSRFGIEMPAQGTRLKGLRGQAWRERMYDPELTWMDEQVGKLLDWLREHDQYDDTIVIVTADHGQGLAEGRERHGWPKHRLLYDWCIRVPLIVRIPGRTRGEVVQAQVRTIDILPTVLEALDVGARQPMEGASLLPLIAGQREDVPRLAYADALNRYDTHSPKEHNLPPGQYDNLFCVTDGVWKLIWHQTDPGRSQLFHLRADPAELENLYRPDHPELGRLRGFLEERRAMEVEPPGAGDLAANAAALKDMGYVGDDGQDETSEGDPDEQPPPSDGNRPR